MGNFGPAEIAEIAEISKGTQIPQIAQKFGHHRWLYVSPAEIADIAERSHHRWRGYRDRLKARN